jgi:hypothetical protein
MTRRPCLSEFGGASMSGDGEAEVRALEPKPRLLETRDLVVVVALVVIAVVVGV